jgi:hypothetical protein
LFQHRVNQGRLAVVNVCNDRNVTEVVSLNQTHENVFLLESIQCLLIKAYYSTRFTGKKLAKIRVFTVSHKLMKAIAHACLAGLITALSFAGAINQPPRATAHAQTAQQADVAPEVRSALDTLGSSGKLGVIVRLRDAVETKPLSSAGLSKAQMQVALVSSMQAQAAASQAAVMAYLQQPAVAAQVDGLRAYWIINGFAVQATAQVIDEIAARPDVASVQLDGWVQATQDEAPPLDLSTLPASIRERIQTAGETPATFPFTRESLLQAQDVPAPVAGVMWGVHKIRADKTWHALNVTGEGIIVANIDSGVDWNHPALQSRYRGFAGGAVADHLHNWYDATDEGAIYPSDPYGHGTHVMGIMVGQDGVGVAPGARWMAVKGLSSEGSGKFSWLHSAFQFILAPGGDPSYAPDILNNSWGATNGYDQEFKEDLAALRAAGIFVVFSNGNRGPLFGSVASPASNPSVTGVGASDSDDDIAYFSSRGPSPLTNEPKPTIVAPGVQITSTFPGGGYKLMNGTSMAAPHVAGVAALMLSANPTLDITQTLYAITSTAMALTTGTAPNNTWGWGRIDAYSATLAVMTSGVVSGIVTSAGQPIANASILAEDAPDGLRAQATTDADGRFVLRMAAGVYAISAGAFGYFTQTTGPRIVISGALLQQDFDLQPQPAGVVKGAVRDASTGALITATVTAKGTPRLSRSNIDCPACRYELSLPVGTYVIEARVAGYRVQSQTVDVADGAVATHDFALAPAPRIAFVDSGAAFYGSAAPAFHDAFDAMQLGFDEFRIKHIPQDTPTITQLLTYDAVIWSAPYDAPSFVGASNVLSSYLAAGKNLLLTGQNIALYDGGGALTYSPYFLNQINAVYSAKNRDAESVTGAGDTPIAGMTLPFTNTSDRFAPDVVQVLKPTAAQLIGDYDSAVNGISGAGVWSDRCVKHRSAYYAFGLENLALHARVNVMQRTLDAFAAPRPLYGVALASANPLFTAAAIGQPGQTVTHALLIRNTGDGGATQTFSLSLRNQRWATSISQSSVTLAPCASARITVTVAIPASAGVHESDVVEVNAVTDAAPAARAAISMTSKTPASMLLVDDDRFFNREGDYLDALTAQGSAVDRWSTQWGISITSSPPITFLKQYPVIVWQNGYDWYDPISTAEQKVLMQYLDAGGRLFFTSQAALAFTGLSPFVQRHLGVADIDFDDVFSNVIGADGTPLGDGLFGGTLLPFPYNWNLSSAVQPTFGTQVILRGDSAQPAGLSREEPWQPQDRPQWRTVFMPFAFEALAPANMRDVTNRIVGWLSPLGHSSFNANAVTLAPGQSANITLTLRADDVIARMPRVPHAASVSVTLPAGLTLVASSMPNAAGNVAGAWSGQINAGDVMTWVFTVGVDGSVGALTPLTLTAHVALDDLAMKFVQTNVIRVSAPALEPAITETMQSHWRGEMALRTTVKNAGLNDARNAVITTVVPATVTLDAGSVVASLPGKIVTTTSAIIWQGDIPQGATLTLDVRGKMPVLTTKTLQTWLLAAVQADDRSGRLTQATITLAPFTDHTYWPFMARDSK